MDGNLCSPAMSEGPAGNASCSDSADNDCDGDIDSLYSDCTTSPTVDRFQNGVGGFSSTVDTYITEAIPNSSFSSRTTVLWDFNNPSIEAVTLIRFDDIFGTNPGQVPLGSNILSAILTTRVTTAGGPNPGFASDVLISWNEAVTWNTFGGEPGYDSMEVNAPFGEAPYSATSCPCPPTDLDVTASVAAWSGGTANHGWMFSPIDTNVVQIASSETNTTADRPSLTITYD